MAEENNAGLDQPKEQKADRLDRRPAIPNLPPDRATLNAEQFRAFAPAFANRVFGSPEVADKILASGLVIRFMYYDELWGDDEIWVTINCRVSPVDIQVGPSDIEPDVTMKMHADLAHKFWMQKLNLTMAVARSWVLVKGAIPKLMRMIPFMKPGYVMYKETLADQGHFHLLSYPADLKKADAEPAPANEEG